MKVVIMAGGKGTRISSVASEYPLLQEKRLAFTLSISWKKHRLVMLEHCIS